MPEYVLALTTCPPDEAGELAMKLVKSRHCACANIIPGVRSIYHWKGELEDDTESIVLMKTERFKVPVLEKALKETHSYDVPEFVVIPIIEGSKEYLRWITDSIR
jgi:periplasmic divalent cation tolerance protein